MFRLSSPNVVKGIAENKKRKLNLSTLPKGRADLYLMAWSEFGKHWLLPSSSEKRIAKWLQQNACRE